MTNPCNLAKNLSKTFGKHFVEFTKLKAKYQSDIEELSKRLADLEEKERERSREDHNREINSDEPEDKGQCSVCNIFYSLEDLYVVDTKPSDDYYDIEEIYECKYCKKEGRE